MSTPKYTDSDYSLGNRVNSSIERRDEGFGWWLEGTVQTPYGIVIVYADEHASTLTFVAGGRCHYRSHKTSLTKRGLATAARRFAAEKGGAQ